MKTNNNQTCKQLDSSLITEEDRKAWFENLKYTNMKAALWKAHKNIPLLIHGETIDNTGCKKYLVSKITAQLGHGLFSVKPEAIEILTCPFCGAEEISIVNTTVVCDNCCKIRGPELTRNT